ncbi:hypothetical protein ERJ75_000397700 [Trypanosoma vivax]|nr:hypothetical protein ERJ75_000397700 [Trypanosoma vivax]
MNGWRRDFLAACELVLLSLAAAATAQKGLKGTDATKLCSKVSKMKTAAKLAREMALNAFATAQEATTCLVQEKTRQALVKEARLLGSRRYDSKGGEATNMMSRTRSTTPPRECSSRMLKPGAAKQCSVCGVG